jgi:type III pantothenate kinase
MNLILDVGNTSSKIAVFNRDELLINLRCHNQSLMNEYKALKRQFKNLQKGIVSKVGTLDDGLLEYVEKDIPILSLSSDSRLPFNNKYKTPNTLGVDRLALAAAATYLFPGENALVIDAGTCITYDFVDKDRNYLGGAIAPGLKIRYTSLNEFTAKLPLLQPSIPHDFIGDSTEESIHSGVVFGACQEIDGFINAYKLRYKDLTVILTGGDAKFLSDQLKNSIFANSNFLLTGLNYLLNFNTKT